MSVTGKITQVVGSTFDAELHVDADGEWRQAATVQVRGGEAEVKVAPVRTTKLRLEARDRLVLSEIEVYGPEESAQ